jgi:hypothetical protein
MVDLSIVMLNYQRVPQSMDINVANCLLQPGDWPISSTCGRASSSETVSTASLKWPQVAMFDPKSVGPKRNFKDF